MRVLYIQHAGAFGGSAVSLLELVKGLNKQRYEPIVAFIHDNTKVISMYTGAGIESCYWPGIDIFPHTTGGFFDVLNPLDALRLTRTMMRFQTSIRASEALIRETKPDIIHLNSLVLPSCAIAAKRSDVTVVWHIRESVVHGIFGLRRRWLGGLVKRLSDEAIFISVDGRKLLVNDEMGVVIPNYVDFDVFDYRADGTHIRRGLGISDEAKVVLFLGGRGVIKGIFPLLKAMPLVKRQVPEAHLLVGGGAYHPSGRLVSTVARSVLPAVGYGTVAQRVDKLLDQYRMRDYVHMLEWYKDVPQLLAACDMLVFPSIAPHFARPVIEAGAMKKPVVASRIGGVEELVDDRVTGILVLPGDVEELADAIVEIMNAPKMAQLMGEQGFRQARQRFELSTNVQATMAVYERLTESRKTHI